MVPVGKSVVMLKPVTHVIDALYCKYKGLSSIYMLVSDNGDASIVDSGSPASFPQIVRAIESHGVSREQLKSIFVTHSHLDHSGNVSLFTRHFPGIKVFCSRSTADSLIDPTHICVQMAKHFGDRWFSEFQNEVQPIPSRFFEVVVEGSEVEIGRDRSVRIMETPGHTADHISIIDESSETIFTGDAFGLRYPMIDNGVSVYAAPISFNANDVFTSLDRIVSLKNIKRAGITHFGFVHDMKEHAEQCRAFTSEMLQSSARTDDVGKALKAMYEAKYGVKCLEKWHRLAGNFAVNCRGMRDFFLSEAGVQWRHNNSTDMKIMTTK